MKQSRGAPGPYNFCDYRCARCRHALTCPVCAYRRRLADRDEDQADDPDTVRGGIQQVFADARRLAQGADGLPLEASDTAAAANLSGFVAYRLAREYLRQARALCSLLERSGMPAAAADACEDVRWYQVLIVSKTGRLILALVEPALDESARSVFVRGLRRIIGKSLRVSRDALRQLDAAVPEQRYAIADLTELLDRIARQLKKAPTARVGEAGA